MNRVVAYVDGFNLYFGLKEGYGRRYHWLDLQRLVAALLQPDQQLVPSSTSRLAYAMTPRAALGSPPILMR